MPYVYRNTLGQIVDGYDTQIEQRQEFVPADSPEWLEFVAAAGPVRVERIRCELGELDRQVNRAIEDLVGVLRLKNVVSEEDLPEPLLVTIAFKERLRKRLRAELRAMSG